MVNGHCEIPMHIANTARSKPKSSFYSSRKYSLFIVTLIRCCNSGRKKYVNKASTVFNVLSNSICVHDVYEQVYKYDLLFVPLYHSKVLAFYTYPCWSRFNRMMPLPASNILSHIFSCTLIILWSF